MAADTARPAIDLSALADRIRAHAGLTGKAPIGAVSAFVPTDDPVRGPGDDGAIVDIGPERAVACGEALFPPFVAADPHGAGVAAVLANVNDVAAMGGLPEAIVNTIVASPEIAAEVLRGMQEASEMYDVPVVGGHLTRHEGPPALSAFAVGRVSAVLSMANLRVGQDLVFVCGLDGHMREDFPFFTSLERQGPRLSRDIRLLARAADEGLASAAKDVSMAGPIGSLAMLLEYRRLGVTVDLDALPRPASDLGDWLICFPTYAFWLAVEPDRSAGCLELFREHDLAADVVGVIDADPALRMSTGGSTVDVIDLAETPITGLWAGLG